MPVKLTNVNYSPLYDEMELEILDENKLAEHVAYLILGNYLHVKLILNAKKHIVPRTTNTLIGVAQKRLKPSTLVQTYKRDGWLYQMINWVAINQEHIGQNFFIQIPHDAPAQHGLDGVAVLLTRGNKLAQVIISEDKYTENPRATLLSSVWPEFKSFEEGKFDDKLVARITNILSHVPVNKLLGSIQKDIYRVDIRKYRASITPDNDDLKPVKRLKLFEGYDGCVNGSDHLRRNTLTFYQSNIRTWMDTFSQKVFDFLDTLKT